MDEIKYIVKKIKNFPNHSATGDGKILNDKKCIVLKQQLGIHGYYLIWISYKGVRRAAATHRIIAETFIPNPHSKPQVNHINGIKTDNRIENLEWVTRSENAIHSFSEIFDTSNRRKKQVKE